MTVTAAIMISYIYVVADQYLPYHSPSEGRMNLAIISITSGVLAIIILIAMTCVEALQKYHIIKKWIKSFIIKLFRTTPWNFIALGAFTIFEGISVSYVSVNVQNKDFAELRGLLGLMPTTTCKYA